MKKFFLFNRESLKKTSSRASDTGVGLSTFAVPADNLSFITAAKGAINITFSNTSLYEDHNLLEGEAIEKTNVTVSCNEGEEVAFIENILSFIVADNAASIMRFDASTGKSSFDKAVLVSPTDILAKVKTTPTVMTTGERSKGTDSTEFQRSIGDIFFGENLPTLDFNHEGLSIYSNNDEVTSWNNAGTKGVTHSIAANVGDPRMKVSAAATGLAKSSVLISLDDYFVIPNSFTAKEDYTLYVAYKPSPSSFGQGVLYGDDDGETVGFCFGKTVEDEVTAGIGKAAMAKSTFKVRHDGRTGEIASVRTDNVNEDTISYVFPENADNNSTDETCHVFVIRRDKSSNMYLHNRSGELVAFIKGFDISQTAGGKQTGAARMTDGDLLIQQLGSANEMVATSGTNLSFKGHLARFGVIEKDIGPAAASQLAQDLFKLYNF
tara:strand:+ start:3763 stop:5070 length:1308 start_codon:yes stop_codon:yes gene_type:complete